MQERRCTPKIPPVIGDFVGSRRRVVETKNRPKCRFRGLPKHSAECSGAGCGAGDRTRIRTTETCASRKLHRGNHRHNAPSGAFHPAFFPCEHGRESNRLGTLLRHRSVFKFRRSHLYGSSRTQGLRSGSASWFPCPSGSMSSGLPGSWRLSMAGAGVSCSTWLV